jgi:peptide deformylase
MAIRRILTVHEGDPVLRRRAREVHRITPDIRALLADMVDTMRRAPGVGLAAPQIGIDQRLIVVEVPIDPELGMEGETRVYQLADPEIVEMSTELEEDQEACLSIPGLYGEVERHAAVRVRAIDVSGRRRAFEVEGYEARVFQHEIDHLDGILYTDRVASLDKLYRLEENEAGELVRVPYRPAPA